MTPNDDLRGLMNRCGKEGRPFVFGINFEMDSFFIYTNPENCQSLLFDFDGFTNNQAFDKYTPINIDTTLLKYPVSYEEYLKKFNIVHAGLSRGDSFLINLTCKTPVDCKLSLQDIYYRSSAKYKLCVPGQFVCFSPETFIKIKGGKISSYPMKGTICASLPDAANIILSDDKETAEHATIVDLIRNDLSIIANGTKVNRYRYIDKIHTDSGAILQVSSEIESELPNGYEGLIGDILISLLPAGSISGAPKKSTVDIIRKAEGEPRGYYTGVAGYFDGQNLDSCVLIRYIEEVDNKKFFRSGGGITFKSDPQSEYDEIIKKVYLPIG